MTTYTERMLAILKIIFNKEEISTELLTSTMLAFGDGALIMENMTNTEIGEVISQHWIESAQRNMIETVKKYNRQRAQRIADEQTITQIADMVS